MTGPRKGELAAIRSQKRAAGSATTDGIVTLVFFSRIVWKVKSTCRGGGRGGRRAWSTLDGQTGGERGDEQGWGPASWRTWQPHASPALPACHCRPPAPPASASRCAFPARLPHLLRHGHDVGAGQVVRLAQRLVRLQAVHDGCAGWGQAVGCGAGEHEGGKRHALCIVLPSWEVPIAPSLNYSWLSPAAACGRRSPAATSRTHTGCMRVLPPSMSGKMGMRLAMEAYLCGGGRGRAIRGRWS